MSGLTLVTGFGAFPGAPVNPTASLAIGLAMPGEVVAHVLPVTWAGTAQALREAMATVNPARILLLGLATSASSPRLETRAENRARPSVDADGTLPSNPILVDTGPPFLRVGPLARELRDAIRTIGIKSVLSHDAGGYLCNVALWEALAWRGKRTVPVAFLHLPLWDEARLEPVVRAVLQAIRQAPLAPPASRQSVD